MKDRSIVEKEDFVRVLALVGVKDTITSSSP